MVRQALIVAIVLTIPRCTWGQCGPQNYDQDVPPDFSCPSPEEEQLVPRLNLPRSLAVEEGETVEAPFDGALVARERLELMGLRLKAVRRLRWLDRRQSRLRVDIEQTAVQRVHSAQMVQMTNHRDHYQALAESAQGRDKWYSSYWFGFLCGAVVAVGLVALSVYALAEIEHHSLIDT